VPHPLTVSLVFNPFEYGVYTSLLADPWGSCKDYDSTRNHDYCVEQHAGVVACLMDHVTRRDAA
jgi:hypothetical protein